MSQAAPKPLKRERPTRSSLPRPPTPRIPRARTMKMVEPGIVPDLFNLTLEALDKRRLFYQLLVNAIVRVLGNGFPQLEGVHTLRQWARQHTPRAQLDPQPKGVLPLCMPALRIEDPRLPRDRIFLLFLNENGSPRITVLHCGAPPDLRPRYLSEREKRDQAARVTIFIDHPLNTLGRDSILDDDIVPILFKALLRSAVSTDLLVLQKVTLALTALGRGLDDLWKRRGLRW